MAATDNSYAFLAMQFAYKQLQKLNRQLPDIRKNKDTEHIHQARVAARRLLACMNLLQNCFSDKKTKKWKKQIRRLVRELGPARDKDVQIAFIKTFLKNLEDKHCRTGIERILLRLKQQRKAIQPDITKAIDRLDRNAVLDSMAADVEKSRFSLIRANCSLQSPFVFQQAKKQILRRLNQLLLLQQSLENPDDTPRHHQMRIAAKRLRYTMEIYMPAFEHALDDIHENIKKVQSLLGEIHDCDVWLGQLNDFLESEYQRIHEYCGHTRPFARMKTGIDFLCDNRKQQKNLLLSQLQLFWKSLPDKNGWNTLTEILDSVSGTDQTPMPNNNQLPESPKPLSDTTQDKNIISNNDENTLQAIPESKNPTKGTRTPPA